MAYDFNNLPAFNAGEDSMGYMRRIGMSDADATSALEYSKANPTASFQDILARNNYNVPALNPPPNSTALQNNSVSQRGVGDIGTSPAQVAQAQPAIHGAIPQNPNTSLPGMQPGEGALQYYLRIGMDPNTAASTLVQQYGANAGGTAHGDNPVQFAQNRINQSYQAAPEFGWHGGPLTATPITLNTRAGNVIGYDAQGKPVTQGSTLNQGPEQKYYPGASTGTPTAPGSTASTPGGTNIQPGQPGVAGPGTPGTTSRQPTANGLPAFNPGESSQGYMSRIGMSPDQIKQAMALSQANPGMSFQDIISKMGWSPSGAGPAGAAASGPPTDKSKWTYSGGLPDIYGGESSESYMRRIGMNDNAVNYAMQIHRANPSMSFQQILEYMKRNPQQASNGGSGGGGPGTGGSPTNPRATTPVQPTQPGTTTAPAPAAEEARRVAAWEDYYRNNRDPRQPRTPTPRPTTPTPSPVDRTRPPSRYTDTQFLRPGR